MINHHVPTVFAVLVVLAALAAPASAAEHPVEVPAVATPGIPGEAEAILGAKLLVCNTCHGADGVPRSGVTPIIWGQQEAFLQKQLLDFQSGERPNEVMTWMATALTPAEVGPAASYFAKRSWPARSAGTASTPRPNTVAVCEICHQQNFVGGPTAPRLAGQGYDYLVESMRRFAEGAQAISAANVPMLQRNTEMVKIMEAVPPAEREALARYISSL